jgi:flagellar basal-body rod protein FlgB
VSLAPANKQLLLRMMSAATLRARVLAANVANQNTPGYLRRDVVFEDSLAKAIERGGGSASLNKVQPEVTVDTTTPRRADGNNVDMETEVSAGRENRLMFELYAAILRGQSRLNQIAVRSER